jgi:membrane protease YdiL (CAAX protease family)
MSRVLAASTPVLLLAGLGAAATIRVALGMPNVAASQPAALAFVGALGLLAAASSWRPGRLRPASIPLGVAGAAVLMAGPLCLHLTAAWTYPALPLTSFPAWAVMIVLIAGTEEVILRGALFDACSSLVGPVGAVAITSAAFAAIHLPLYGVAALPLDLVVGMWLGGLRLLTGGVAAPATAHILADLCAWWML